MSAYSFLDVQGTITGPGGSFPLGNGAGAAEEGITISMDEDKGDTKVGADGAIMQSLRASKMGRITVRLLKTSPVNALLSQMYNLQSQSSALWGNNTIVVSDVNRGDVVSASQVCFTKQPDISYARDANVNEWIFRGAVVQLLGSGSPAVAA